jgi:hypothetical protein
MRNISFNEFGETILIEAIEKYKPEAISALGEIRAKSRKNRKNVAQSI